MKIGIMLRHYDQHGGGVKVYTHNLLKHILELNTNHQFVFLYKNPKFIGTYSEYKNVKEIAVKAHTNFMWDHLSVPQIANKEKIDVLFNPKYSIPLGGKFKKVFVCHGLDWYAMPWGSKFVDQINHKYIFPKYCKTADSIIAVSDTVKLHLMKYLNVPEEKISTVYSGVNEFFKQPVSQETVNEIKIKYNLPEKYFLYVGQIYPPKNFGRILQSFAKVGPQNGFKLVVAGEHRWLCDEELALIKKLNLDPHIQFLNWVDNQNLPALYKSAEALLFPSLYEGFGIPILEAMASGCPVITSDRFATKEIGGNAAIFVNPESVEHIAEGIKTLINNPALRQRLINKGYERAQNFSWQKCAIETLTALESTFSKERKIFKKPNKIRKAA